MYSNLAYTSMTVVEQRVQGASLSDDQGSWEIARKAIYAELFSDGLEIFLAATAFA